MKSWSATRMMNITIASAQRVAKFYWQMTSVQIISVAAPSQSFGAYLLANLTASLLTALRTRLHAPWLLPLAFSILHLAYGLGFLVGLVRFAGRWGDKIGKVPQETLV